MDIFEDKEGEWFKVQYAAHSVRKVKQVQRYNNGIRPCRDEEFVGGKAQNGRDSKARLSMMNVNAHSVGNKKEHVHPSKVHEFGKRKAIYDYIDGVVDELEEIGFEDKKEILSAISSILNTNAIKHEIQTKRRKKEHAQGHQPGDTQVVQNGVDGIKCRKCTLINYENVSHCIACGSPLNVL